MCACVLFHMALHHLAQTLVPRRTIMGDFFLGLEKKNANVGVAVKHRAVING